MPPPGRRSSRPTSALPRDSRSPWCAFVNNVATPVAPLSVYRSAVPWNWIVLPTMPAPAAVLVSTRRYALARVVPASLRPSRPASCLSGRIATRLPPPFTQPVSVETCSALSGVSTEHDHVEVAQERGREEGEVDRL